MSIREDFLPYFDKNDLLEPAPGQQDCDNGTMYFSEYMVMLKKLELITDEDKKNFANRISACIGFNLLNRRPLGQNESQEGPDNYYGVLNACIELGNTNVPRTLLWGCIKYKGSLDNVSPGKWQWDAFLIRQPQLLTAMISASFPSLVNPLHWLIRLAIFPLFFISAGIIVTSCMWTPTDQADPRRLAWHLQNNLKKTSLMCWLGSKIWLWRLGKEYPNLMRDVAGIYYSPVGNNPYQKYWVT
jgi:hypothetical protein